MSRSTFALRFKETVGSSPMDYLTRWRMLLAARVRPRGSMTDGSYARVAAPDFTSASP
jgi:AraC-like DNA-binding protein